MNELDDVRVFPVEWGPRLPSIPPKASETIEVLATADLDAAFDLLRNAVMLLRQKKFHLVGIATTAAAAIAGRHVNTEPVAAKRIVYSCLVLAAIAGRRKLPQIRNEAKKLAFFRKMSGRIMRALRPIRMAGLLGADIPEPVLEVMTQLDVAAAALNTGQIQVAEEHAFKALEKSKDLGPSPLSMRFMQEAKEIIDEVRKHPHHGIRYLIPQRLFEPELLPMEAGE